MFLPCILKPFPLQGTDKSSQGDELKKASRQRGVCVDHLKRCKTSYCFDLVQFYFIFAGGHSISLGLCPTKLPVKWDIQLGQLDVPASVLFPRDGTWLTQEPPSRFICQPFALFNFCTVVAIWHYFIYFGLRCIRTFLRART